VAHREPSARGPRHESRTRVLRPLSPLVLTESQARCSSSASASSSPGSCCSPRSSSGAGDAAADDATTPVLAVVRPRSASRWSAMVEPPTTSERSEMRPGPRAFRVGPGDVSVRGDDRWPAASRARATADGWRLDGAARRPARARRARRRSWTSWPAPRRGRVRGATRGRSASTRRAATIAVTTRRGVQRLALGTLNAGRQHGLRASRRARARAAGRRLPVERRATACRERRVARDGRDVRAYWPEIG
jgi:hypothetical protein